MPKPRALAKLRREDVLRAMANASSIAAAARTLGVDKGSVSRWVAAGKVPPPGGVRRRKDAAATVATTMTADAWKADVRGRYDLTASELQLLEVAAVALHIARDEEEKPSVRIQAAGRFAALVAQLNLPVEPEEEAQTHGTTQTTVRPFPRRA